MSEYVFEMQVRYRAALAWVWAMVVLQWFIGRRRAARWAISGMHHFAAYRIRHVKGGGWGRWHRGFLSVESPDDVFWRYAS